MTLPPPLAAALEGMLDGVSRKALAERAARLSDRYRAGGGSEAIAAEADALAYACARLPATGAALAAVQVFLLVVGLANPLAGALLVLRPAWALVILVVGVGLTLATVLAATWRPTAVSPVVILNDRG